MTRLDAMIILLELPDEDCMHRGYRYTVPRDPRRDSEIIKRDLGTAYVAYRRQEMGVDISRVVSVRRHVLRLVREA